ncbi:aspartate kinase [bacterium]|nr:aspartate kinase [bacterium]
MKGIIIQKFGGTSVASVTGWRALAEKVKEVVNEGKNPVLVVSAMGRRPAPYATDTLLSLINSYSDQDCKEEKDMLMACGEIISTVVVSHFLRSLGLQAEAFDGAKAGISAEGQYGEARINSIDPSRILKSLSEGKIPVIAGFQGINAQGEIVTLGRGGSDTTAVAIGAALQAERVDIFTDVEGIMTADPRLVDTSKVMDNISYMEIGEMANEGAKVLHPRSVDISQTHNLPLRVRSTFSNFHGTDVVADVPIADRPLQKERLVTGVVSVAGYVMLDIELNEGSNLPERRLNVFEALAKAMLSLDMINITANRICCLIKSSELNTAKKLLESMQYSFSMRLGCGKISIVGQAMRGQPGVMMRLCRALNSRGVELYYSTDSHITISAVVPESKLALAAQALHSEFGLD